MIRYLVALSRYEIILWWQILTGRGNKPAPDRLLKAYNQQGEAWNHWRNDSL
jgi:hypothetical protein